MNVLSKIVIPKTNVTSMYIVSEMEEFAREEFFRLKKILEIKRRMFGDDKKKEIQQVICNTCEPCVKELDVIKTCTMCDTLFIPEVKEIEQDTAEQYREMLEEKTGSIRLGRLHSEGDRFDDELNQFCEKCQNKCLEEEVIKEEPELDNNISDKPIIKPKSASVSAQNSKASVKTIKTESATTYNQGTDLELGTFEIEISETTKIVRVKKEDGTISEEKQVIKIKREIRTPLQVKVIPPPNPINQERAGRITFEPSAVSGTSAKSNVYSGSRTIGIVTTKSLDYFPFIPLQRKMRSEIFQPSSPMSDPYARYCVSSVTLLSVDFGEYNSSFVSSCNGEYEIDSSTLT